MAKIEICEPKKILIILSILSKKWGIFGALEIIFVLFTAKFFGSGFAVIQSKGGGRGPTGEVITMVPPPARNNL